MKNWYAIRVTYGRVLKLSAILQELGIEHFVPMIVKKVEKNPYKEPIADPTQTS